MRVHVVPAAARHIWGWPPSAPSSTSCMRVTKPGSRKKVWKGWWGGEGSIHLPLGRGGVHSTCTPPTPCPLPTSPTLPYPPLQPSGPG
jgi:hypothetical protein